MESQLKLGWLSGMFMYLSAMIVVGGSDSLFECDEIHEG